uniref:RxLR effector candidate protein n=1 Tax=Hyaloperonospora arabidopsidis (strain Emoy2) TaxID=559515 RepID=M4BFF6_HYAAE
MTSSSMRCTSTAASEPAARMRAAGDQATQASAAGVSSPARLLLLITSLQHPMLQVHVDTRVQLLHPQPKLRVVVPWTSTPN